MLVIWGKSHLGNDLSIIRYSLNYPALSGNRTPVSRVAGENSTTEPTMLESCECPHSEIGPLPEKGQRYTKLTTMGIEPTIFRFEVGRLIHWATRPMVHSKHLAIKYSNLEKYYITMAPEVLGTLYVNL